MFYTRNILFLAHQSTKWSRWTIVIGLCPLYVRTSFCMSVNNCLKNHTWNY